MANTESFAARFALPVLFCATVALTACSLFVGSAKLSPSQTLAALVHPYANSSIDALNADTAAANARQIIWSVRLPRVLLTFVVGAGLSLAGLAAQTLFLNPLATPYVLGVSNGAAVGAVFAALGGAWLGLSLEKFAVPLFSVAGGIAVGLFAYVSARRATRFGAALLLSGVAVSAFCSALTAFALYVADERLQILVFWLMGGFWNASWSSVLLTTPCVAAAYFVLYRNAPALNVLLAGERAALDLGVNSRRLQKILLAVMSIVAAICVAVSGVIGFVGLVVPHTGRLVVGADHRRLIPVAAIGGAALLLAADMLARTVDAPAEVPVGAFTAFIGAPVFLRMLRRRANMGEWQ